MKRILTLLAGFGLLASCSPSGYTLTGTIENCPEGAIVRLASYATGSEEIIDSTRVEAGGNFELKGRLDYPTFCNLIIDTQPGVSNYEKDWYNKVFSVRMYVENSPITIEADANTLPPYYYNPDRKTVQPVITGSKSQDEFNAYNEFVSAENQAYREADDRYMEEYLNADFTDPKVTARGIEAAREIETIKARLQQRSIEYIAAHPASVVSLDQTKYLLMDILVPTSAEQLEELAAPVRKAWEGTPKLAEIDSMLLKAQMVAKGRKYIDMELVDPAGKRVRLSEYVTPGKYTMLEFWASWCGPCRGEIPHLRHVNEVYGPKGFDIVSISIDEKDSEWQKAMIEEKMIWKQLNDPEGFKGPACSNYNIIGVPTCIVLDPEGCIAKINMRGAFLDAFLQETYDQK